MTTKAEDYWRRAEEADAKARAAQHPDTRAHFREAAKHWRILAEAAEQMAW